jgi:hypothetical protein
MCAGNGIKKPLVPLAVEGRAQKLAGQLAARQPSTMMCLQLTDTTLA